MKPPDPPVLDVDMKALLGKISSSALDLLFPLPCAGCGPEGKIICQECLPSLPKLTSPYCAVCATPGNLSPCRWCRENPSDVDGTRAPFLMEGLIKQAIHSFKYRGVRAAAPELGSLLAGYLVEHPIPGDVLMPVPLHSRRLRYRGYNQSALLAREMAKHTGHTIELEALVRTKDSLPQVEAGSSSQRRSNVERSFQCTGNVAGGKVILVDDVATTGSTLSACAASLKEAGAASVWGLVLARENRSQ